MKTDSTRSTYAYNMKRFMKFLVEEKCIENNEDYEQVSNFDSEKITNVLEDFVAKLNKKLKPAAISTMLAASELFFDMNRKTWFRKLVRRGIKKEFGEPGGRMPATDEDIQEQAIEEVEEKMGVGNVPEDVTESEIFNHARKEIIKSFNGENIGGLYLVESLHQIADRMNAFLLSSDLIDEVFGTDEELTAFLIKKIRFFTPRRA